MIGVMRALGGMLSQPVPAQEKTRPRDAFRVRQLGGEDALKVSILQTTVFDQPNEARMTVLLRDQGALPVEVAAFIDGRMVGHLSAARLRLPEGWLTVLPMAVLHGFENRPAIQIEMITELRRLAREMGAQVLVATGDPKMFGECGFYYRNGELIRSPFPGQLTGLCPLKKGALDVPTPIKLAYPQAILDA